MGLKDLLTDPNANPNNQSLGGVKGPQFSIYSNTAYFTSGEPDPNAANFDTIHEKGLVQNYTYSYGDSLAIAPASRLDLDGQTPQQYINNPPQ
jgi:hypothetical protein